MGEEEMRRYIFRILLALQIAAALSCEIKDPYDVSFSYAGIIDKEYRFNVGRVIPVTIGQSIETDGDISADGKYFYYTSNVDSGNFDIYLRAMNSITTVRITDHPSRDTNPVISPDGKTLAFVSFRDDPEGDIFTLKIDAASLISSGKKSAGASVIPDSKLKNLTSERQGSSGVTFAQREANPVWSPDGKWIAFSRTVRGETDIWIMKKNGSDKKQITKGSGDYPSFSPDGKSIIYVSYGENIDGDINIVEIDSGRTEKVISGPGIKLYPCYAGEEGRYIYSLIAKDTNKNGRLDLDDRSVLQYYDAGSKVNYRLTKESVSSFKAKWLSSVSTRDYRGIILYTDITGENINLNMIPDTGIIPKKQNARLQFEFCTTYIDEWDDEEKYRMSLDAVHFFFGGSRDKSAMIYVDRALGTLASYYIKAGRRDDASAVTSLLKARAGQKNLYASLQLRIADDMLAGRKSGYEKITEMLPAGNDRDFYMPFALEDAGDLYYSAGDMANASRVYRSIISEWPGFERAMEIQVKISLCEDDIRTGRLSDAAVKALSSGNANQRITVVRNLISFFQRGDYSAASAASYLKNVQALGGKYREDKKIIPIVNYSAGLLLLKKGDQANALKEFVAAIESTPRNDIISHLSNIMAGDIERRAGRSDDAEKYYSEGFNSHSRRFRTENLRERLLWLVDYYEQKGQRLVVSGRFMDGAKNHEKNIHLLTRMHNKRLFPEIYTAYASRAHVLYVDSFLEWKGENGLDELEKSYNDNMPLFRMDFNRAAIYGLAYIYTRKALYIENSPTSESETRVETQVVQALAKSDEQIEWALFLDDTFVDPYLLKSWNYQYIDYRRSLAEGYFQESSARYFPEHLWEKSIPIMEKALIVNDETKDPENEGNLNLNMGNTYFLLQNYPRALRHYQLAVRYKKSFGSEVEKALFHFHYGYCHWQNDDTAKAREEIGKAYSIYRSLSGGRTDSYASRFLVFYRYFALFSRYEGKYDDAIKWYSTILDLADKNSLDVDRARYLQEIARCYIEKGDADTATAYINQAEQLLARYPDDTRKYYAKIKLFGIIPFFVWDMGPDSLVIGETSIFYPLDRFSKRLLNLSMLEEIALKNNDYSAAIRHVAKKIKLTEKKGTALALDIRIRSQNNLGYYYFLSGQYAAAEKQFTDTGKLALEKGHREGMFTSTMNLVNLYSMMIEENIDPDRDWLKVTESAIKRIRGHRNTYRDLAMKQQMEELERKAESSKREVTSEEKEAATLRVESETAEVNYRLDIAVSTLMFYRAEILYAGTRPSAGGGEPYNLYTANRSIFNLYKEALAGFETALQVSGVSVNPELRCRILINSGVCYEKSGDYEKAYVAFIDAKSIADRYELRWLKISSGYALGSFMNRSGSEVEKGDSAALADRYMSGAVELAGEHPLLVISHAERIRSIYREYIQILIAAGNTGKAFTICDRYAQFSRIALVNSLSPEFKNSYDSRIYYDYIAATGRLSRTEDEISELLKAGAKPESEALASLRKKRNKQSVELRSMYDAAVSFNPLVASYLEPGPVVVPDTGYDIYRFHDTPRGIYWWRVSGKKISSGYLKSADSSAVNSLLSGDTSRPVFILLSETFVSFIKNGLVIERPYSAINSMDRAGYYIHDTNPLTPDVASSEGFDGSAAGVRVAPLKEGISLERYSTIAGAGDLNRMAGSSALFSSGIMPGCVIRSEPGFNYSSVLLQCEAALYAGTTRLIFTVAGGSSVFAGIIGRVYGFKDKPMPEKTLVCGYIKTTSPDTADLDKTAAGEYRLYTENLSRLDLKAAAVHLSRWYSIKGADVRRQYYINLWHTGMLSGDYNRSAEALRSMKPAGSEEQAAWDLMNICQLLYEGKISQAESAYNKMRGTDAIAPDAGFIEIILSMAKNGDSSAVKKAAAIIRPYKTIIPTDRYLFLILTYAALAGDGSAAGAAALIPSDCAASERDRLLLMTFTGKKISSGSSIRFDRIAALFSRGTPGRTFGESAAGLFTADSGYDRLSLFPIFAILNYYTDEGDPFRFFTTGDIAQICRAANPADALVLCARLIKTYEVNADYGSALTVTEEMKKYSHAAPGLTAGIYEDQARLYSFAADYRSAYTAGLEAERQYAERGIRSNSLELLMISILTATGQYAEAGERAETMKSAGTLSAGEKYQFNIQLALIELHRLSRLKTATVDDAAGFEKLFASTVTMLTDDPSLASGPVMEPMTRRIFDEYVNYRMRTGSYNDAHYYSEIKKLVLASARSGANILLKADASAMGRLNSRLPAGALYVNISGNRKDLFVWLSGSRASKAFIIDGGYASAERISASYRELTSASRDTAPVSAELKVLLAPVYAHLKNVKIIIFCCDSLTEKLPLEIAGEERMLADDYSIVHVSSPLLLSDSPPERPGSVQIVSYSNDDRRQYVERAAVRESGVPFAVSDNAGGNAAHVADLVNYSSSYPFFTVESGWSLDRFVAGSRMVYITAGDMGGASVTDLVLAVQQWCSGDVLISNPGERELNSPVFIESFYGGYYAGSGAAQAFIQAADRAAKGRNSQPADRACARIYMRSLSGI
jgi:TolB protein